MQIFHITIHWGGGGNEYAMMNNVAENGKYNIKK